MAAEQHHIKATSHPGLAKFGPRVRPPHQSSAQHDKYPHLSYLAGIKKPLDTVLHVRTRFF